MSETSSKMSRIDVRIQNMLTKIEGLAGKNPEVQIMVSPNLIPLHQAIDSLPYIVKVDGRAANNLMIKLMSDDGFQQNTFRQAVEASVQASDLGLSPTLIAWDSHEEALVYDLLNPSEWRCIKQKDFADQEILARTLERKRFFHHSPRLATTESPFDHIRLYKKKLNDIEKASTRGALSWEVPEHFNTLNAYIDEIELAINAAGFESCPTHGEPALSNIMLGMDKNIKLVDFDRSVNADPFTDIAGLALEAFNLDWGLEQTVELYCGHFSEKALNRIKLYMIVEDFKWGCWALVNHYQSSRRNAIEFYKSAFTRFIRCRYWLSRWNIPALLKNI